METLFNNFNLKKGFALLALFSIFALTLNAPLNGATMESWKDIPSRPFNKETDGKLIDSLLEKNNYKEVSCRVENAWIDIIKSKDGGYKNPFVETRKSDLFLGSFYTKFTDVGYFVEGSISTSSTLPPFTRAVSTTNTVIFRPNDQAAYLITIIDLKDLLQETRMPTKTIPNNSITQRAWTEKDTKTFETFAKKTPAQPLSSKNNEALIRKNIINDKIVMCVKTSQMNGAQTHVSHITLESDGNELVFNSTCSHEVDPGNIIINQKIYNDQYGCSSTEIDLVIIKHSPTNVNLSFFTKSPAQITTKNTPTFTQNVFVENGQEYLAIILDRKTSTLEKITNFFGF